MTALISLTLLSHTLGALELQWMDTLENVLYDTRLNLTMPGTMDERIVIIDVDEPSLARIGQWPWGRDRMAALVHELVHRQGVAALGIDAVLLTPASSDPLYRRSIRVSMGNVFNVPWTYMEQTPPDYVGMLKDSGFVTAAMALRSDTLSVDDPVLSAQEKLAVILGTEGEGLKAETIAACDHTVKIPMQNGVDSLNVASASGIVFWELRKRRA